MRYVVAMAVSAILIVCMFVYANWMMNCARQWQAQNAILPDILVTAVNLAYFISSFWYMIVPFLLAIPLAIAAVWPRTKRRCQDEPM